MKDIPEGLTGFGEILLGLGRENCVFATKPSILKNFLNIQERWKDCTVST